MSWWVTFYLNQIAIGNEYLPIIVTGIEEGVLYYRNQLRPGAYPPLGCAVECAVCTRKQPVQDSKTRGRGVVIPQAGHTKRGQPVLR